METAQTGLQYDFCVLDHQDFDDLVTLGREFYETEGLPGTFNANVFIKSWSNFLDLGIGFIVGMKGNDGVVIAAIGGLVFPDPNTGELTATETFWFASRSKRGNGASRLPFYFEEAARKKGAKRAIMVHLENEFADVLAKIYTRLGYRALERHYIKEL